MNPPCAHVVSCLCDESPVANLSVEKDDPLTYPALGYPPVPPGDIRLWKKLGCLGMCYSLISQEDADLCAERQAALCANPNSFLNTPQSCSKTCPDGTIVLVTCPAGLFAGDTQAEADAKAYAWACDAVDFQMLWACNSTQRFYNTFQACTLPCDDGSGSTWNIPSGVYFADSQAAADKLAYDHACAMAQSQCPPPNTLFWNVEQTCSVTCPDGSTSDYIAPAHTHPGLTQMEADTAAHNFCLTMAAFGCTRAFVPNSAQSCTVTCPNGSMRTETVGEGMFFAADQASADLLAQNYACSLAQEDCSGGAISRLGATGVSLCPDGLPFYYTLPAAVYTGTQAQAQAYANFLARQHRVCLGNIPAFCCSGSAYLEAIQATGNYVADGTGYNYWDITSGSLPPGLTFMGGFQPDAFVFIQGATTTPGTYHFTVRITTPSGDHMSKPYTVRVVEITTVTLPDYTIGTPYSYQLTAAGGTGTYRWTKTGGTFPTGMSVSITGLIHGTPTAAGSGTVTLSVTDI